MKILLIQATFVPVFALVDEDGRPTQTFVASEKGWLLHHADLAGLVARVETFEREAAVELAAKAEASAAPPP